MIIAFNKYQATGNDFIIIDDRDRRFDIQNSSLIQTLCNRRFGIGADGLIVIRSEPGHDFRMIYFNADGYEGSMCGNGGRCATAFANILFPDKKEYVFKAFDGVHHSKIEQVRNDGFLVSLSMSNVELPNAIGSDVVLNTGSPHYVQFVDDSGSVDVALSGRSIRNSEPFLREGINVNFVEVHNDSITVRTYERGVEEETLSCGTGVTASAIAAFHNKLISNSEVNVFTRGGDLKVGFKRNGVGYTDVILTGEAHPVFQGVIEI
ncbi:MAG: diaminopimelate epimerase [Bacteroidia bacterium]